MGNKPSSLNSDEDSVTMIPSHRMRRSLVNTPASRVAWRLISFPMDGADLSRVLAVQEVDMMGKKNRRAHHTKLYDKSLGLPVRRGQAFTLRIICNRERDEKDGILIVFRFQDDDSPSPKKPTLTLLQVAPEDKKSPRHGWTAKLLEDEQGDNKTFMVEVTPSVNCVVGYWYLCVDTYLVEKPKMARRHKEKTKILTLFNAWSKDDPVYMSEEDLRHECVLEDAGFIFIGDRTNISSRPWTFDQYKVAVVKVTMFLLTKSGLTWQERSDPVWVSRMLSSLVNDRDNDGLLVGKWSDKYEDGTNPSTWTGSGDIYIEYYKTKTPVKYGQCWVYAGLLATACRTLGIPSRPVTCFSPGMDLDGSLMVEFYVDQDNKTVEKLQTEKIWNFHVWVEAWMIRKDLNDPQYDGWQYIDGSPAIKSDGIFRKGPCSVAAVKKGEILLNYDVPQVLASVNADKVTWLFQGEDKPFRVLEVDTKAIGRSVSTKAVGSPERVDLTTHYKHAEGSLEEDSQMHKAWLESGVELPHFERQKTAIEAANLPVPIFSFIDEEKVLLLGESFSGAFRVENPNALNQKLKVKISMKIEIIDYAWNLQGEIKSQTFTDDIDKEQTFALEATYDEYEKVLGNGNYLHVRVLVYLPDNDYYYLLEKTYSISPPPVLISTSGSEEKGVEMNVDVRIQNTLPKPLTNGYFKISGSGIKVPLSKKIFKGPVAPSEYAEDSFKVTPIRRGRVHIHAQFYAPQMGSATGYQIINVK